MRRNIYFAALTVILVSVFLWGCGSQNVAATVNGEKITVQELDEQVNLMKENLQQQGFSFEGDQGKEFEQMLQENLLSQMIDQKLILQEAKNQGLTPSSKDVTAEIDKIKEQLGTEGEFKKFLAANGVTEPKLEELVKQQHAMQKFQEKLIDDAPKPSEEEIAKYFEDNKASFSQPEERQVSHILIGVGDYSNGSDRSEVDAKVLALQVVAKLKAGASFADLAKQYSDDPGSKDNGGQYPPFSRGSGFVEEFETAAFNLQVGEYTAEPVKTSFGYHIIKLDQATPAKDRTLAEVKENIVSILQEENVNQKMDEFMQELRDKAEIDNKIAQKPDENSKGEDESKSQN